MSVTLTLLSYLILQSCLTKICVVSCTWGDLQDGEIGMAVYTNRDRVESLCNRNAEPIRINFFGRPISQRLFCHSLHPILWKINGINIPRYAVEIPIRKKYGTANNPPTFSKPFGSNLKLTSNNLTTSLEILCESVTNSTIRKIAYLGISQISVPTLQTFSPIVKNSKTIPCFTYAPTSFVALFKDDDKITNVKYIPTVGFISDSIFDGNYTCRQGRYLVQITALALPPEEHSFSPKNSKITSVMDSTISLKCASEKSSIKFKYDALTVFEPVVNITYASDNKSAEMTIFTPLNENKYKIVMGNVTCSKIDKGLNKEVLIKEWTYQSLAIDIEIKFTVTTNELSCSCGIVSNKDLKVDTITIKPCKSGMECQLKRACVVNSTGCVSPSLLDNDIKRYQMKLGKFKEENFSNEKNNGNIIGKLVKINSRSYRNGLLICNLTNGINIAVEYFTSMDESKIYRNWKDANLTDLVMIDKPQVVIANDVPTQFNCTALKHLFPYGVKFELEFSNGTRQFLDKDRTLGNYKITEVGPISEVDKLTYLYTITLLSIVLPEDAVAIRCHGIWWNSTDTLSDVARFRPKKQYAFNYSIVYIGSILSVIAIITLSCLLLIIAVYRKKYIKAKERIRDLEIPMNDMQFDSEDGCFLGAGQFSYVVKGKIISQEKSVAVKISKPTADVELIKAFLLEVKIMISLGKHENLVELVGVYKRNNKIKRSRSICIATEICELGSLEKFLQKSQFEFCDLIDPNRRIDMAFFEGEDEVISTLDLISFSAQIARGMEYLANKSVVHADLATRNVLLTWNKTAKISDFGLSRQLYRRKSYVKNIKNCPLPWKWMAPESLVTLKFSTKSDVWSFGVTLYEIFSLGEKPFPDEVWSPEFLRRLRGGMRMARPTYSTPEIYSKITSCWELTPEHRPEFSTLRDFLDQIFYEFRDMFQANEATATFLNVPMPNPAGYTGLEEITAGLEF